MPNQKPTTAVDPLEDDFGNDTPPFATDDPPFDLGEPEDTPQPRTRPRHGPPAVKRAQPEPQAIRPPAPREPTQELVRPSRPQLQPSGNIQHYAEQGMEGLEVTYGAYPVVRLINEGVFETHDGEALGKEFLCILQASKPKFIYKAVGTPKGEEKFAYTFDHEYTAAGEPLHNLLQSWLEQGYTHEVKKYLDVLAVMMGEREGEEVLLSIPKTSIGRLTRYLGLIERKHQCLFNECITRVACGEKIKSVQHPFYPWSFEFHGKL